VDARVGRAPMAVVLMLILAGCSAAAQSSSPGLSVSPTTSPSETSGQPSSAAAAPSRTPVATPSSSPAAVVTIRGSAIRSFPFPGRPLAVLGSRVLVSDATFAGGSSRGGTLREADLATGQTRTVSTLDPGHMISALAVTADRAVWVEVWRIGPTPTSDCGAAARPLNWRLVGLVVSSGVRTVIASGANTRIAYQVNCAAVNPPELAVAGDRVAYTLEATAPGAPFGNRIVVRSLADGSEIRRVTTKGYVPWLGLSGHALAYRETLGSHLDGSTVQDAQLMLATADDRTAEVVDVHVISAAVNGDLLAWGAFDATDASIWTTSLSTGARAHVAGPASSGFKAQGDAGSWWVSLTDGYAAWVTSGTVNGGDQSAIPFLWKIGEPGARLVVVPTSVDSVSVSDGWLIWHDDVGAIIHGVQLAALGG
jgi:hypothetical protein